MVHHMPVVFDRITSGATGMGFYSEEHGTISVNDFISGARGACSRSYEITLSSSILE